MRNNKLLVSLSILALAAPAVGARFSVEKIEPPHWWTSMKNHSLQLQVFGKNIKSADFSVDYPGVTIDSVARLDGTDDWQFVYLNISPETEPGVLNLEWKQNGKKVKKKYELRKREHNKGAQGFTSADVLYMVMPDRFADGNPDNNLVKDMRYPVGADRSDLNVRHGGDIKGVIDNIDYIDSLGVTAVWFNPVLENDIPGGSYHGYATTDYYSIDPRFGSNDDYAALIDSLHNRNIKTVMDMIFNHCGITHPWFSNRPAKDWFNFPEKYEQTNYRLSTITDPYASDYDRKLTTDGWFVYGMPDLNQRNPHLMKYLIQNSIWWIEESGIDGIRMDTYPYADYLQMARWIDDVKAEYPNFNIVGECWFAQPAGEAFWQKGSPLAQGNLKDSNLPVVMDFPFMILNRDMAPYREKTDPWNGLNKVYDHLALDYIYPDPLSVMRFLDNHDTERYILEVPDSLDQWKQGVALLLTLPGIPQLYYGTELLMAGDRKPGDGNVRRDMPGGFPGDETSAFVRSGRSDLQNEAFDFISTINKWRRGSQAIAKGVMKHFMPTNGVYLYERKYGDERAVVVMNGTDDNIEIDMTRYAEIIKPGSKWRDILTGNVVTLIPDSLKQSFSPRQILILEQAE